ncbi:ribosome maturation factor RimM [Lactobacillus sp. S2-2]|uniref:ribosome maturation factor RimM n=1 Tax=Lactobacillus sp. S2-2 TaxID=2692917 RepID=UPI001EEDF384|nr:ribosome maturation factor RimM [Lactobacillus sp. S2-2]MCF6515081.1 ribosome maturation factor RimM [Lactobacillus sp. S2-2]
MGYLNIGKLVNTQGIKGEVRVQVITDFPEKRFKKHNKIYAFKNDNSEPIELEIDGVRKHKNFLLLHFVDKDSINDVEFLKPSMLKINDEQQSNDDLKPGEYYYSQILGLKVFDIDDNYLGEIKDIMDLGPNDVWVVKRDSGKDLFLPKIDDVIKNVDLNNKKVTVNLMEGLE